MTIALAPSTRSGTTNGHLPSGGATLSTHRVGAAIDVLLSQSATDTKNNWLRAVARLVVDLRPDIGRQLATHLGVDPLDVGSPLDGMSIGDLGVVYEALVALSDHHDRRRQGQYFTPDDVASYMANQAERFGAGDWLDPCCGIGNLSWHLANSMENPRDFIANRLTLVDLDPIALRTAMVLLVASFAAEDDTQPLHGLVARCQARDFLDTADLPKHDYVIMNPPYAGTETIERFRTASTRELYAYFLERVALGSRGFIAITPASHLGGSKYAPLREVLQERSGGEVFVFDNVPDTCFRGFKYGSTNTSKTNFVRAAITVSAPNDQKWRLTPILRWSSRSRRRMWAGASEYLVELRYGPRGEWAKVMPGTETVWDELAGSEQILAELVCAVPTQFALQVASTPRYYVSASKRNLDRGSKHTLHFRSRSDMDRAYVLLNSSLPYWWWRCLDGGITLQRRTLLSMPLPRNLRANRAIIKELEQSESRDLVVKLNAGRTNENIRRPRALTESIDRALLPNLRFDFTAVYSSDMFGEVVE